MTGRRRPPWPGLRRLLTTDACIGLALAVLTWPVAANTENVVGGLDQGWRVALTMAVRDHIPFGSRAVFTYGPLSFLVTPQLYFRSTSVLAFLFTLGFSAALLSLVVRRLRRTVPVPLAVAVAYLLGAFWGATASYFDAAVVVEESLALVMVVCVSLLSRGRDDPAPAWTWVGLGGALSLFSLIKVSLGVAIGAALVLTLGCMACGRRRPIGLVVAGAVPVFCVAWFGTGNGVANLYAFGRSSVTVLSGYGPAMALEDPSRWYSYWLALFVLVVMGVFAVAHGRRLDPRPRVGVGLVTLVTLWFIFKESFVRHDVHDLIFFVSAPLMLVAFSPRWRSPVWLLTGVFTLVMVITSAGVGPVLMPVEAVHDFGHEAGTLLSSSRTAATIDRSEARLRAEYKVSHTMLDMMRGHTVDVSPWEQTVVWAYPGLRFDPLPVVQDYTAYTAYLDQLDVRDLASAEAPRFILREPLLSIDSRNPSFEPPATQLAMECRYEQVALDIRWQLLERGPDRCASPRLLDRITTGAGHWVTVPAAPARDEVVASFALSSSPWSAVVSALYKPPSLYMWANAGQRWRFVAATAPDLHVLRASSALGYTFGAKPTTITRLRFTVDGSSPLTTGISVSFYAVPMRGAVALPAP